MTTPSASTRPATQLAPPTVIEPAFDAPDEVLSLIRRGAPYKSIAAVHKDPAGTRPAPWFRNFWALGGKVLFPGAEAALQNPRFIAAAKDNFQAQLISPLAMMTNLNAPAPAAAPHLDLPYFRGAHKREVPSWLLAPMGYSGLFHRWAIPVASAISWFFPGEGGELEYWPDGLNAPSRTVGNFASNQALIADNEYMYHRVRQIGATEDFLPNNEIPYRALLELDGDRDGWVIRDGEQVVARYPATEIRLSVLWKAFCFRDRAEADAFANGSDNLTPAAIVDVFQNDLRRRGARVDPPANLDGDDEWAKTVRRVYGGAAYE